MSIGESSCERLIDIRRELIGGQDIPLGGEEMQLVAKVFPLLRSHLCSLRRSETGEIDGQLGDALTAGRAVIFFPISCRSTASSLRVSELSQSES